LVSVFEQPKVFGIHRVWFQVWIITQNDVWGGFGFWVWHAYEIYYFHFKGGFAS